MLKNFNMNLIKETDSLVVAVSGGIDSMVLLDYLNKIKNSLNLTLTVCHVDHKKRVDSADDLNLVVRTCDLLGIGYYTKELKNEDYDNFHDYAHTERYDFFVEIAKKVNANKIVLAHNKNDHAETILMRLTRGSSFEGYRGILQKSSYKNIQIIRPLITVSRSEIKEYQEMNNIIFNEDSSNKENNYTRNRFRHNLLPLLENENPKYLDKITQFSNYQEKAYALIEKLSTEYLETNLIKKGINYYLDISSLKSLDEIVLIEVIKKVVNFKTNNSLELTYQNIDDVIGLINNEKPQIQIDLDKNLTVYKSYDNLIFGAIETEKNKFEFIVDAPQKIKLPDNGLVIITKKPNNYLGIIYKLCYNNLDLIFPLTIRNRQNGDKIITKIGTKKVKDILINKKVPMETRNKIPMVLDKNNEIIWIPNVYKKKTTGSEIIYIIYQEGNKNA